MPLFGAGARWPFAEEVVKGFVDICEGDAQRVHKVRAQTLPKKHGSDHCAKGFAPQRLVSFVIGGLDLMCEMLRDACDSAVGRHVRRWK